MSLLGGLISSLGGLLGSKSDAKAQREANERNYQMQKEFAQNGIQWKVQDAEKSGIHPLYAIGAPAMSASPSFASEGGSGIGKAAESIGRSLSASQQAVMDNKIKQANLDLVQAQADKVRSDMILNMKKASERSLGRQAIGAGGSGRVPLYKKVWDNLEKRYIWLPNPDLGIELPDTYGSYQLLRSLRMDGKEKNAPDWALKISAHSSKGNWDPSTWVTFDK